MPQIISIQIELEKLNVSKRIYFTLFSLDLKASFQILQGVFQDGPIVHRLLHSQPLQVYHKALRCCHNRSSSVLTFVNQRLWYLLPGI